MQSNIVLIDTTFVMGRRAIGWEYVCTYTRYAREQCVVPGHLSLLSTIMTEYCTEFVLWTELALQHCNCKNLLTKPNAHINWMLSVWQSQKKYYSFPREMSKFHSCPTGWAVGVNIHYSGSAPSPLPTHGAIAYRNGVHFCQYILQSRGRVQSQAELGHSAVFSSQ